MRERLKLTRNGDTFEASDLFAVAKILHEHADFTAARGAFEISAQSLKLARRFYNECADYQSAQECSKQEYEQAKRQRLKHEQATRITASVISVIEQMQPNELRFKRKDVGVWTATAPGFGKRATLQFTLERQGEKWIAKTSKSVPGHGFVPAFFDTLSNLKEAKLACERRLIAVNDAQEAA